jgi:hypothetical protein
MRVPDDLQALLDDSGLPWRIDNGKRHYKIIVDERLVGILPKGRDLHRKSHNARPHLNTLAQIRRIIRQKEARHE